MADVLKFGFGGALFWLLFAGLILSLLVAGVLAAIAAGRPRI